MRAVIREKIAGDGGEIGRELLKGLKMSIEKVDGIVWVLLKGYLLIPTKVSFIKT